MDHDEWLVARIRMEARLRNESRRQSVAGERRIWLTPSLLTTVTSAGTRIAGCTDRGARNAKALRITEHDFVFPDLPEDFDGYTILLATDFHVGVMPDAPRRAAEMADSLRPDLVVLGGDYQTLGEPMADEVGRSMRPLMTALSPPDGIVAILGNHDTHEIAHTLHHMGARVLLNEWMRVDRGASAIHLLGTDDVHAFFTEAVTDALAQKPDGFCVALVHSPELATRAAKAGIHLYLAGHTHGGQISLPGGTPIMTALDSHRSLAVRKWQWRGMQGYTSTGLGAGAPAVRFNTVPELALIRLRCGGGGQV